MRVRDAMVHDVKTCRADEPLTNVARVMWEHTCGCVPIVDEGGGLVGILTDRDVCMAAYHSGMPIHVIPVRTAMSRSVHACAPEDDLAVAEETMARHKVRRLPVVDPDGRLVGILSLDDVARALEGRVAKASGDLGAESIRATLAAVCERPADDEQAVS